MTATLFIVIQSLKLKKVSFDEQASHSLRAASRDRAYYFELREFADNAQELIESGFDSIGDNHQLETKSKDNSVFIHAIPQQNHSLYIYLINNEMVRDGQMLKNYFTVTLVRSPFCQTIAVFILSYALAKLLESRNN